MPSLSYFASKHGDLQQGERYKNVDYIFLSNLLSQAIIFYDTCYQIESPSATVDVLNRDDVPDLEDVDGSIIPKGYRRPKERTWPFAKL
ncbi:hypothetical protein C8R43DRAFT_1136755 [Mycena crocata]|nr:hypothetical protein C8R43DRAFT_1136755 [Mycena crocata]